MVSTLDGAVNHHNSDSEDDLDYVPGGEGQGVINPVACFKGEYLIPNN